MIEFLDKGELHCFILCFSGIFSGLLAALSNKTKDKFYSENKYSFVPLFQFICLMGIWSIFPTIILLSLISIEFAIFTVVVVFITYKVLSMIVGKFMLPNFIDGILFSWSLIIFWTLTYVTIEINEMFPFSWSDDFKLGISALISIVFLILLAVLLPNSIVNRLKKILDYEFK